MALLHKVQLSEVAEPGESTARLSVKPRNETLYVTGTPSRVESVTRYNMYIEGLT